jgi:hypothetical protein
MGRRGRKDIAKDGEKSRFGAAGGVDPAKATKMGPPKWSIRKQLAHFAAQNVDLNDRNAMKDLLGNNPTVAQVIAAAALMTASKGDMTAVHYATENIDGKLPQVTELTGKDGKELAAAQTVIVNNLGEKSLDELTKLFTDKIKG